jgi:tetratricopeptide (TPR) repeat protein
LKAGNKGQVGELGDGLSRFYHDNSLYQKAFFFASQSYGFLKKETPANLLNRLGLIFDMFGNYKQALIVYEQAHEKFKATGDKAGEGTTLNNISLIYSARGDYQKALNNFKQALAITRDIGDKAGEGATLNNIGQIYKARGDYQKALEYLGQSLIIQREIGDKAGMISTLHNLALSALKQNDAKKYFEYHGEAWQLAMETEDAMGLFNVGKSFGKILSDAGDKKNGLEILKIAYTTGKQSGLPGTDEIGKMIRQFEST